MKTLISLLALAAFAFVGSAHALAAGDAASAPTKQQTKMGTCNKEAGDKKGAERKAFMKECLSAKPAAASADSACATKAAEKKLAGAAKASFVKKCEADSVAAK